MLFVVDLIAFSFLGEGTAPLGAVPSLGKGAARSGSGEEFDVRMFSYISLFLPIFYVLNLSVLLV